MSDGDDADRLRGEVAVTLGRDDVGRWALPRKSRVTLGRRAGAGVRLDRPWVSATLATLTPLELGWLLENGTRTRVRVSARPLDAVCEPNGKVLLYRGRWTLDWDLDDVCTAHVTIGQMARPGERPALPWALDSFVHRAASQEPGAPVGTDLAGARVELAPEVRHVLAVLFRHLIDDRPPPVNMLATAADELGYTEAKVRNIAIRARDRVAGLRRRPFESLEDFGYYLVRVAGMLTADDLSP